jgi:hypothetical protein
VQGIVEIAEGVFGLNAPNGGHLKIETSQWESLLAALGYTVGPSGVVALSSAGQDAPSWREAGQRLEAARKRLRDGDDDAAVAACLGEFPRPLPSGKWKAVLPSSMPTQKSESVAGWLGGFLYLSQSSWAP